MTGLNPYVILAVLIAGFAAVIYFIRQKPKQGDTLNVMMEWMKEIKAGTELTRQGMQKSIDETNKAINERLDNAAKVIAALNKELGSVGQIGPDIRRLTETLTSPKLRGNFGEEVLENLLTDVFPKEFCKFQFRFKNGEVVDAAIMIGDLLLPIDSKFSMENYRLYKEAKTEESADGLKKAFLKDVKKRIDEIHKKYILPHEGTFDYALMFIPSEGVYMETANDQETQIYSRGKKVIIVGPNTLNITLRGLLVSLRGQQISKAAQQVLAMINGIKQESDKFNKTLDTLTNHVKNTNNTMSTVVDGYAKLRSQIVNASNLELEAESTVAEALADKKKVEELPEKLL
ncbi:MAG: DNA recombination protein RmuC [Candidatus Doudnabacteria bacterium]|nr:DNA recombination protein RmuC [Candidatus Doudnabacteria bacterium]